MSDYARPGKILWTQPIIISFFDVFAEFYPHRGIVKIPELLWEDISYFDR